MNQSISLQLVEGVWPLPKNTGKTASLFGRSTAQFHVNQNVNALETSLGRTCLWLRPYEIYENARGQNTVQNFHYAG